MCAEQKRQTPFLIRLECSIEETDNKQDEKSSFLRITCKKNAENQNKQEKKDLKCQWGVNFR